MTDAGPRCQLLVPAKDEAENLPEFVRQCAEALPARRRSPFEVVVVDDGSRDAHRRRCCATCSEQLPVPARRDPPAPARHRRRAAQRRRRRRRATSSSSIRPTCSTSPRTSPTLVAPILAGRGRHRHRHQAGQVREGLRVVGLQRALPLALRRARHRPEFGEGLPARGHAGAAAAARLAPLHGGHRRGGGLPAHLDAGAAVSARRPACRSSPGGGFRSACSTCSRSGSSSASAASRCSSSASPARCSSSSASSPGSSRWCCGSATCSGSRPAYRIPSAAQPGRDDGHQRLRAVRLRLHRRDDRRHARGAAASCCAGLQADRHD